MKLTLEKKEKKKKEGLGAFISISRYLRHQIKFWSLLFLVFYMKLHGKSLKFSHWIQINIQGQRSVSLEDEDLYTLQQQIKNKSI